MMPKLPLLLLILVSVETSLIIQMEDLSEAVKKQMCKGLIFDREECGYNLGNLTTGLTNNFTLNNITNSQIKSYEMIKGTVKSKYYYPSKPTIPIEEPMNYTLFMPRL